jgi:hypothetical protein
MPYAPVVYAELSFGQGLLSPEYLNVDKVFSSSVAEKKDKTENDGKLNKT